MKRIGINRIASGIYAFASMLFSLKVDKMENKPKEISENSGRRRGRLCGDKEKDTKERIISRNSAGTISKSLKVNKTPRERGSVAYTF
jgi:hypothetical protein